MSSSASESLNQKGGESSSLTPPTVAIGEKEAPPQDCKTQEPQEQSHPLSNPSPSTQQQQQQQQELFPKPHPAIQTLDPNFSNKAIAHGSHSIASTHSRVADSPQTPSPPPPPSASASSALSPHHHHTPQPNPPFVRGDKGVREPLPTDVICGRGKMTASHPANRRFRELVDSHKTAYQNSKRRDEKTRITIELVDKLRAEGRFVLFDPNTKLWHEVSEEYAREKVSHSLRSRSASEHRHANPAVGSHNSSSSSIQILQHAIQQQQQQHQLESGETPMVIAPRAVISHSGGTLPSQNPSPDLVKTPDEIGSQPSPNHINIHPNMNPAPSSSSSNNNNSAYAHGIMNNKPKPTNATSTGHRKKTGISPMKAAQAHKAQPSTSRSKHSLEPNLDGIVQRLIQDQQALLRVMIQKETERFTGLAAVGNSPPLSFQAEASAVSALTTSLHQMGKPLPQGVPPRDPASTDPKVTGIGVGSAGGAAKRVPNEGSSSPATVTTAPNAPSLPSICL